MQNKFLYALPAPAVVRAAPVKFCLQAGAQHHHALKKIFADVFDVEAQGFTFAKFKGFKYYQNTRLIYITLIPQAIPA